MATAAAANSCVVSKHAKSIETSDEWKYLDKN